MVLTLSLISTAWAAEFRGGEEVVIGPGEVIEDDLYISGGTVTMLGTVKGDLFVGGGQVTVAGTVEGDLFIAGGQVIISGTIKDDVRVAGGYVTFSGKVSDDLFLVGGMVTTTDGASVGGQAYLGGGQLTINGKIAGRVRASGGQVTVGAEVNDDVTLTADTLVISPSARIAGDLRYTSSEKATIRPGAEIRGQTVHVSEAAKKPPKVSPIMDWLWRAFKWLLGLALQFLTLLAIGYLLLKFGRTPLITVLSSLQRDPWPSLGWGALWGFIGLPLAIALVFALLFIGLRGASFAWLGATSGAVASLWYLSRVAMAALVGDWLTTRAGKGDRELNIWDLLVGLTVVVIAMAIPCLGWLIALVVYLFVLGAVWLGLQTPATPRAAKLSPAKPGEPVETLPTTEPPTENASSLGPQPGS